MPCIEPRNTKRALQLSALLAGAVLTAFGQSRSSAPAIAGLLVALGMEAGWQFRTSGHNLTKPSVRDLSIPRVHGQDDGLDEGGAAEVGAAALVAQPAPPPPPLAQLNQPLINGDERDPRPAVSYQKIMEHLFVAASLATIYGYFAMFADGADFAMDNQAHLPFLTKTDCWEALVGLCANLGIVSALETNTYKVAKDQLLQSQRGEGERGTIGFGRAFVDLFSETVRRGRETLSDGCEYIASSCPSIPTFD